MPPHASVRFEWPRRFGRATASGSVSFNLMVSRVLVAVVLSLALHGPARAQTLAEVTATPDGTAEMLLRSIRALRWSTTAQLMHPQTLERFDTLVSMLSVADTTGEVRQRLTGTDAAGFASLSPQEVFGRSITAMIDEMPGLKNAFYDHDDHVLGHVSEGVDTAQVVYRTLARIGGAVPEVKVMQLVRTAVGWRVLWSDEIEVLDAALRGMTRRAR